MKIIPKRVDNGETAAAWNSSSAGFSPAVNGRQPRPFHYEAQKPRTFGLDPSEGKSGAGFCFAVAALADIVIARQFGRKLSQDCGFSGADSTIIATIVSELARNIVLYAQKGEIEIVNNTEQDGRSGITVTGRDDGPGISDVERALMGGYSTSGGLGLGLHGVKKLSDEFGLDTGAGKGTVVTAKKWRH